MKTYRVSFDLILEDNSYHPRKWVAEAIWDNLNEYEDMDNIQIQEVDATVE